MESDSSGTVDCTTLVLVAFAVIMGTVTVWGVVICQKIDNLLARVVGK